MDRQNIDRYYADNVGLVHFVAQRGFRRLQAIGAAIEYDDIVQDLSIVFVKAYDLHEEEKGKFSTYFTYAALNELNKTAKKFEIERLDMKIKSVEEMSSGEGATDVTETVASGDETPEQALQFKRMMEDVLLNLSPVAKQIARWLIDPPAIIEREFEARLCHASLAQSKGHAKRRRYSNIGFVCEVLTLSGVDRVTVKSARAEIEAAVERNV